MGKKVLRPIIMALFISYIPINAAVSAENCGALEETISETEAIYNDETGGSIDEGFVDEEDAPSLGEESCLSDLLNIGGSLGVASLDPSDIASSLADKACGAVRNARNSWINDINRATPTSEMGRVRINKRNKKDIYKINKTSKAVNKVWNSLN